jgi:LmbE family N-acetylglucosaminyl deacetylase
MGVAEHHFLGYPDGELAPLPELTGRLVKLLRRLRPAVVVAPDPTAVFFGSNYINHRDHRELGWAALDAVSPGAASPRYFQDAGEPYQVPLLYLSGTLEPDLWVDIGGFLNEKASALAAHSTQVGDDIEWLRQVVREEASQAAPPGGPAFAEAFRRMVLA